MKTMSMTAQVAALAAGQWGMLTTAQAEAEGLTRLQLARLTDAGVLERVDRGVYAMASSQDERTELRAAWMSLAPKLTAEERLQDPLLTGVVSHTSAAALHGVGDLLDDEPEFTVSTRKQSRRGIRLHRAALEPGDVTIAEGLPVTTPARTVADLLRDGHDVSHVADVAGDVLRRDLATRNDIAMALDPLARRNDQADGAALLEHLLEMVGLSSTALASSFASSGLGPALVASGQLDALRRVIDALPTPAISPDALESLQKIIADAMPPVRIPQNLFPQLDLSSTFKGLDMAATMNLEPIRAAIASALSARHPNPMTVPARDEDAVAAVATPQLQGEAS